MKQVAAAAKTFIEAIHAVKDLDEEAFYADAASEKSYRQLWNAVSHSVQPELQWKSEIYDICMSYASWVREYSPDLNTAISKFTLAVDSLLETLSQIEWIACVPLERVFSRFPLHTDFEAFSIVNVATTPDQSTDELINKFRTVLTDKFSVAFVDFEDVHRTDSYLRLADHYYRKSGKYIPGRPMLVLKIGKGEPRANERLLQARLNDTLPLIQLCQLFLGLNPSLMDCVIGPHSRLPNGDWMDAGLIEVPSVAVAVNTCAGDCDWWGTRFRLFETRVGRGYDYERFMATWYEVAKPIIGLRQMNVPNKFRLALDNAIRIVARCRHEELGDAILNAVIAIETILNPLSPAGDIAERFALMVSAIAGDSTEKRRALYRRARELYRYRCDAVHRSHFHSDRVRENERKEAVELFKVCLLAVVTWATRTLAAGSKIDTATWERFYVETVIV